MKIKVDLDRVTLDDVIALEEGKSAKTMRDILARFVVDATGDYVDHAEGKKRVGALNMRELKEVSASFADAMKGAQAEALPPTGSDK